MIRASGLYGRAVIDLDTAERVGEIDEIIVDPYGPGIAGYVVSCDRSAFRSKKRIIVPIDAIHAIGPDAITMRSAGAPEYQTAHLDALPRLSELTGRRMVSFGGRFLGSVEDALVSERDGRIIGYPLERRGPASWLDLAFGIPMRPERPDYVRADASLRIGARMIVVPDDAIAAGIDLDEPIVDSDTVLERPALAPAPSDTRPTMVAATLSDRFSDVGPERETASQTAPFSMREREVTDEGLGLEPTAERGTLDRPHDRGGRDDEERDRYPTYERPPVDPEGDTGLLTGGGNMRSRPRRRVQAEKLN